MLYKWPFLVKNFFLSFKSHFLNASDAVNKAILHTWQHHVLLRSSRKTWQRINNLASKCQPGNSSQFFLHDHFFKITRPLIDLQPNYETMQPLLFLGSLSDMGTSFSLTGGNVGAFSSFPFWVRTKKERKKLNDKQIKT